MMVTDGQKPGTDAAHELTPSQTARILVEALPYIRRFAGKSVIVKLGGAAIDKALDRALAQDVLLLRSVGVRCVVVHGGGPQVNGVMERMGKAPEFRDGRSEEHTSELQSLMRISYAVFCLKKKITTVYSHTCDDII